MLKKINYIVTVSLLMPLISFAQTSGVKLDDQGLPMVPKGAIASSSTLWLFGILGFLSPIFFFVGIIGLLISVIFFAMAKDNEIRRAKSKKWVIIFGIAIVLGIIFWIASFFGLRSALGI